PGQPARHRRPRAGRYSGARRAGGGGAPAAAPRGQGAGPVRAPGRCVSRAGGGGVPQRRRARHRSRRRHPVQEGRAASRVARSHGGDRTLNTRRFMKLRKILTVAVVTGLALVTGGWLLQREAAPAGSVYQQARLFEDVLAHVADYYVDSLDERQLYQMAIDGMLEQPLTFKMTRATIHIRSVPVAMMLDDRVGYVQLNPVSETSTQDLSDAIGGLLKKGMKSLLLDLRGNPGGLLDQGVAVSELFLDPGEDVVATRGRAPNTTRTFKDAKPQLWPNLPVVVLVNGGTASAAEIITGA